MAGAFGDCSSGIYRTDPLAPPATGSSSFLPLRLVSSVASAATFDGVPDHLNAFSNLTWIASALRFWVSLQIYAIRNVMTRRGRMDHLLSGVAEANRGRVSLRQR
jgi:hypothetical protein